MSLALLATTAAAARADSAPVLSFVAGDDRIDARREDILDTRFDTFTPPQFIVEFGPDFSRAFERFTTAHVGEWIDTLLCGALLMRPWIQTPTVGGAIAIQGKYVTGDVEAVLAGTASCPSV